MEQKQKELDSLLQIEASASMNWFRLQQYAQFKGLNPNYVEPDNRMAITHRSAYEGQKEILSWCLDTSADVNAQTVLGRTPLHYACMGNYPQCVSLLIARGADVMAQTVSMWTPLHFCCHYKNLAAENALLAGATDFRKIIDVDIVNDNGATPQAFLHNEADQKPMQDAIIKYAETLDDQKMWLRLQMMAQLPASDRPVAPGGDTNSLLAWK